MSQNKNIIQKHKNFVSNENVGQYVNENFSPVQRRVYNNKNLYNPFSEIKKVNIKKRISSFNLTNTKMIIKNNKEIFNKFYGQKIKKRKSSFHKEDQKNFNEQLSVNSQQTLKKFSTNNINNDIKDNKNTNNNNNNNINNKNNNKNNKKNNVNNENKNELINNNINNSNKNNNNNFLNKIKKILCFCLPT
jgi:hypothetical protein